MKQSKVPKEYAGLFYFRDLDLRPERLSDYPYSLSVEQCRELYARGWLFHSREDALRVREIMRRAYIQAVACAKGSDAILFDRPLMP